MLRESDHRRRHAAFAGLSLGFIFLIDYYQTVYAMFFALCYLIYYLFGKNPSPKGGGGEGELAAHETPTPNPSRWEGSRYHCNLQFKFWPQPGDRAQGRNPTPS